MAKITTVTYERLSNQRVGKFENERIAATATVDEGENPAVVAQRLKRFVDTQLGLGPTEDEIRQAHELIRTYGDWSDDPFSQADF